MSVGEAVQSIIASQNNSLVIEMRENFEIAKQNYGIK